MRYQSQALLSLWATIMAQTIDGRLGSARSGRLAVQNEKTEELLTQLLPTLNSGLAMKKAPELVLGCYVVTIILVSKTDLDDSTLDAILSSVVSSWTVNTFVPGLGCAAVIAQRKESLELPLPIVKAVLKFDSIGQHLQTLSQHQDVSRLTECLLQGSFISHNEDMTLTDRGRFYKEVTEANLVSKPVLEGIVQTLETRHSQDLAALEQNCQASLLTILKEAALTQPPVGQDSVAEEDVTETTQIESISGTDANLDTSKLPKQLHISSFLGSHVDESFLQLQEAFSKLVSFPEGIKKFENLDLWHSKDTSNLRLIGSFYVISLCTSKPTNLRVAAAKQLTQLIQGPTQEPLDSQSLFPYVIVALSDEARQVRQAVASLAEALLEQCSTPDLDSKIGWNLYHSSSVGVPLASTKTLHAFLKKSLRRRLEECVADRSHVQSVFQNAMQGSSVGGDNDRKRLKSSQRVEIMKLLSWHAKETPLHSAKLKLLQSMNKVDKIGGQYRSVFLSELLKYWVFSHSSKSKAKVMAVEKGLNDEVMNTVHPRDQDAVRYLLLVILEGESSRAILLAAASRFRAMWPHVRTPLKQELAVELLKFSAKARSDSQTNSSAAISLEILQSIRLSSDILNEMASRALASLESTAEQTSKRRRLNEGLSSSIESTLPHGSTPYAQLSLVLELVDVSRSKADIKLFHNLFLVLQAIQNAQSTSSTDLDFLQVLAVTNLLNIAESFADLADRPVLDQSIVRVDLLTESLKKTSNSQIRNAALSLLATLSQFLPDTVLHNVIPVFTLMSTTAMRQNDEYSVQIVDRTIKEVVPRLADTFRKHKSDLIASIEDILWSFAAAFAHIPHGRQLRLYNLLASSLGPEDSLFAIIATLVDQTPMASGVRRFVPILLRQFTPDQGLVTLRKYSELLRAALQPPKPAGISLLHLPSIKSERDEKVDNLCAILVGVTMDGIDTHQLRSDMEHETASQRSRQLYGEALENLLGLSKLIDTESSAYEQCARALENLLKLPTFASYLDSIGPLLDSAEVNVSKSVLKSLEVQLRLARKANSTSKMAALKFIPRLTRIVHESEIDALKLNAVVCIDRISEDFGKLDLDSTIKAAEVISRCTDDENELMRTLAMHCLASMVPVLEGQFIPLLKLSVQAVCKGLDLSMTGATYNVRMHNAAIALCQAIVDNLAYMLSPRDIISVMERLQASANCSLGNEADESRHQLCSLVADKVDIKTNFEAASQTLVRAIGHGSTALKEHISLIQSSVDAQPKSTVSKYARALLDKFLNFFDIRRYVELKLVPCHYSPNQLSSLEDDAIGALISLVLKVNDATFRPFFVTLVEWTTDLSKSEFAGVPHRRVTLFNFFCAMSDRLKSLVTPYAGFVIDPAADILRQPPSTDTHQLVVSVFGALTSSFKYDTDDFYQSPTRFETLHPALLAQMPLHSPMPSTSLTQAHIIPTITAFAVAVSHIPDHLNMLNSSILEFLKGKTPPVLIDKAASESIVTVSSVTNKLNATRIADRKQRGNAMFASVLLMRSLTRELGDEWLGMLPQMLPVVNELLEDDDERVVKETHEWVREMEGILGESVGDMLG